MLVTLLRKELLQGLLTFRFAAALAVTAPLWGLSLWVFAHDFQDRREQHEVTETVIAREHESMKHARMARGFGLSFAVPPQLLSVFARGLEDDMTGPWKFAEDMSELFWRGVTKAGTGPLYENRARAFFPVPELATLVRLLGSLLALLFTYDAFTREREEGTLALCCANQVPRDAMVLTKAVAAWLLLTAPAALAGTAALAALMPVSGLHLAAGEWLRLLAMAGVSALYLLACCAAGLAMSAWFRTSSAALLGGLALWVLVVLMGPGLSRAVGEGMSQVVSGARLESEKTRMAAIESQRLQREADRERRANPINWARRSEADERRIEESGRRRDERHERSAIQLAAQFRELDGDWIPRRQRQEDRVRSLARWSPAAQYLHLVQGLAGTGGPDVQRFRERVRRHHREVITYLTERGEAIGWETFTTWDGLPGLGRPAWGWRQWFADTAIDLGLLALWAAAGIVLAVAGSRRMSVVPG